MSLILSNIPDGWGPKAEIDGSAVTRTRTGPNQILMKASAHIALILLSPQAGREVMLNSDRKRNFDAPAGSLEIVPASAELFARWPVSKESLLFAMSEDRINRLAASEFDRVTFEFQTSFGSLPIDRDLVQLARLAQAELERSGGPNELLLDSLQTAIWIYLIRNYSSLPNSCRGKLHQGGLSDLALRRIDDFMYAHLDQKISIEAMASIIGISSSHFMRAFQQSRGMPPYQYLMMARIARAVEEITNTSDALNAIARRCGFSSNSHMTASLRQHKRPTPTELRNRKRFEESAVLFSSASTARFEGGQ